MVASVVAGAAAVIAAIADAPLAFTAQFGVGRLVQTAGVVKSAQAIGEIIHVLAGIAARIVVDQIAVVAFLGRLVDDAVAAESLRHAFARDAPIGAAAVGFVHNIGHLTAFHNIAGILGAGVQVVAHHRFLHAVQGFAHFASRAGVHVRAGCDVGGVDATAGRVTAIVAAHVAVVAVDRCAAASPILARVCLRALAFVVANDAVVGENAALLGIARVVGAQIAVVATDYAALAVAEFANIAAGTGI